MSNRAMKQFVYGMFYLLILVIVGGSVYFGYIKPAPTCTDNILNQREEEADCGGPCVSCAVKKLRPMHVAPLQLFDAGGGKTTVLAELQNPNLNFGTPRALFALNFYDASGAKIFTLSGDTFVYAGEVRPVVFPALGVPFKDVARSEFILGDVPWVPAADFPRPDLQPREIVTRREGKTAVVEGVVRNGNAYGFKQMIVGAVAANKSGLPANASRTVLSDIQPFEERFFRIVIPLLDAEASTLDTGRTSVFAAAKR